MEKKSIQQLKEEEQTGVLTVANLHELYGDERKGVQQIVKRIRTKEEKKIKLKDQWDRMNGLEEDAKARGFAYVTGIDEAGRGPIAGPVMAGAVRLPESFVLYGLDDSKKLSEKDKNHFYDEIMARADVGIGAASAEEIDEWNIYRATKLAMKRAVLNMRETPDHLLVDAMEVPVPIGQESFVKGDERSVSIAAASVIAKVTRDRFMKEVDAEYPGYNFLKNKGYATKEHMEAIKEKGITPYHRKSFVPDGIK
ncbi:ribonuclease HII [Salimicrobium jeotgali]|uniref:ribonuclease HII n=1 Tax=Salimicrobium jeotgali TaxID=1230341 RepID=UPI000C8244D9|nr:ribonuclease HII [Salimicrobium jeotgali]